MNESIINTSQPSEPWTWKRKLMAKVFPYKICELPEAPASFQDCIVTKSMSSISFVDRLRVLFTGKVEVETRIVTENVVGSSRTNSVIRCGRFFVAISLLLGCSNLHATVFTPGSNAPPVVSFTWNTVTKVGAYRLYYGSSTGVYTNQTVVLGTNFVTVPLATRGATYFFVATAIATNGPESLPSAEVSYTVPVPPSAPTLQQPVILTVQYKNDVRDFNWADWQSLQFDPTQPFAAFRLAIAEGPVANVAPMVKRLAPALPPMPGK